MDILSNALSDAYEHAIDHVISMKIYIIQYGWSYQILK